MKCVTSMGIRQSKNRVLNADITFGYVQMLSMNALSVIQKWRRG